MRKTKKPAEEQEEQTTKEAPPLFDLPEQGALPNASGEEAQEETTSTNSDSGLSKSMESFIDSTQEHLETAEGAILVLEKLAGEVDSQEYLQSILRSFHTIKGNAGFLSLAPIERLSHKAETVLEEIREGTLALDEQSTQLILEVIDTLREGAVFLAKGEECDLQRFEEVEHKLAEFGSPPTLFGDIMVEMGAVQPTDVEKALEQQRETVGDILVKTGKVQPAEVKKALVTQNERQTKAATSKPAMPKTQDIRVSLDKLDRLIDLVGELVISETMISHHPALEQSELQGLKTNAHQLNRYIRDLQEIAMSMRMIPVSSLFHKMVRVVHDTSKKSGKQAELKLAGEKTEVDKTLVEQVADPLLHIIRNAVDHGLETPDERQQTNKPASGTILLEAQHVGNEVWIIIKDDGKGLNREKILEKAKEKGLVSEKTILSDEDIWKLILEPGFSTAETVTDLSGRGVGMDVVKQNIEKLHGNISIHSEVGKGSTFTLQIPLTLTIIDGLLIRAGKVSYALPTTMIKETLQPNATQITTTMDNSEMLRIRQQMLPVLRLHQLYDLQPDANDLPQGMILVIEQGDQLFCLFVDEVIGQQQIVVKGLPESMAHVPHLSGCTILGDGQVGLILDAASLTKTVTTQKAV